MKTMRISTYVRPAVATLATVGLFFAGLTSSSAASHDDGVVDSLNALQDAGLLGDRDLETLGAIEGSIESTTRIDTDFDRITVSVMGSTGVMSSISIADPSIGARVEVGGLSILSSDDTGYNYAVMSDHDAGPASLIIAHDESAPQSVEFEISAGGGPAVLTPMEFGYVLIETQSGDYVNALKPAWALDADGEPIETSYEINGSTLIQHLDLTDANFPVVADPQYVCDFLICTLEFNRAETKTIKENGWQASGVAGLGCGLIGGAAGVACAALGGIVTIVASQAYNQGDCVGIRIVPPAPPFATIYTRAESGYCR